MKSYRYTFKDREDDWISKLKEIIDTDMKNILEEIMQRNLDNQFKWYVGLSAEFQKASDPSILTQPPPYFCTQPLPSHQSHNLDERMEETHIMLMDKIDNYMNLGSGWILKRLIYLELCLERPGITFSSCWK